MPHNEERDTQKLKVRLRKLRGQLEAVESSLTENNDCRNQLMLLAAVRGGVNSLMAELLEMHIRVQMVDKTKGKVPPELAEDLVGLVRAYLK